MDFTFSANCKSNSVLFYGKCDDDIAKFDCGNEKQKTSEDSEYMRDSFSRSL